MIVNSSRGGGSKDTWVLEDGDERADARPRPRSPTPLPPALPDLRYGGWTAQQQQQQQQARLMLAPHRPRALLAGPQPRARRVHRARRRRRLPARAPGPARGARRACSSAGRSSSRCSASSGDGARARARRRCAPDARRRAQPGSMRASVERAREGARTVRDVISAEMWEAINTTALYLRGAGTPAWLAPGGPVPRLPATSRSAVALIWGLAERTMLRDEAQGFLDAGGLIEVADMVLRMLRVALPPGDESAAGATATRSRCCRRSAASRPSCARCRRRRTRGRSRASCCSSAPTPTASPPASTRCTRLRGGRREPARLQAGAAPQPAGRRPRVPAPCTARRRRDLARSARRCSRSSRASTRTSPSATSPGAGAPARPSSDVAAPRATSTMHFSIRYLTEYRYDVAGHRQPQRAARASGDDLDAALRRVPRAHRPRDARQPPPRLLRHRGARVRDPDARTTT